MDRFPVVTMVAALVLGGAVAGCSTDDGEPPADPGGINGPARVDPEADVNVSGGSTDGE